MRSSRQFHKRGCVQRRGLVGLAIFAALVCSVGCTGTVKPNSGVSTPAPGGGTPGGQTTFAISGTVSPAPSADNDFVLERRRHCHHNCGQQRHLQLFGPVRGNVRDYAERNGVRLQSHDASRRHYDERRRRSELCRGCPEWADLHFVWNDQPGLCGKWCGGCFERPGRRDRDGEFFGHLLVPRTCRTAPTRLLRANPSFTFAPGSQTATVNGANVTGVNFTGTAASQQASHGFAEMDGEHFDGEGLQRLSEHGERQRLRTIEYVAQSAP